MGGGSTLPLTRSPILPLPPHSHAAFNLFSKRLNYRIYRDVF